MTICIGWSEYGNLLVCEIQIIIVDSSFDIYFVGDTNEIIYLPELGIYESVNYKGSIHLNNDYTVFSLSSCNDRK